MALVLGVAVATRGLIMFQHVNPIGISISQAKKDAKKLAKSKEIPLSQAQDQIAFKHSRSTWAEAMSQSNQSISLDFKESLLGIQKIKLPSQASLSLVVGQTGAGKSVLCYEIMAQLAEQKIPVTYLATHNGSRITEKNAADWAEYQNLLFDVQDKYPEFIQVFDLDTDVDLDVISLRGGVLIVDETFTLLRHPKLNELFKASKHTFVTAQSLRDLEPLPKEIIQKDAMQLFCFQLPSHELDYLYGMIKSEKQETLESFKYAFSQLKPARGDKSCFLYGDRTEQVKLFELKKDNISI